MKEVFDFLRQYYRYIIVFVFQLVTLIVLICKRKVKIDDVFKQVLLLLPEFINIAEDKFSNGAERYSYVFNRCMVLLHTLTHKSAEQILSEYSEQVDDAIEAILSTPKKHKKT